MARRPMSEAQAFLQSRSKQSSGQAPIQQPQQRQQLPQQQLPQQQQRGSFAQPNITFAPGVGVPTEAKFGSTKVVDVGTDLARKSAEKLLPEKVESSPLEKIQEFDEFILSTDNVVKMFNQSGGFETGPFRISNYPGTIGELGRQFRDDRARFSPFFAQSEQAFQKFRKVTTGAQASDRELRMLRPLVFRTTDRPQIFVAKALAAREIARQLRQRRIERLNQTGRDISGLDVSTPEDIMQAKGIYFDALKNAGMSDNEAIKLVNETFSRSQEGIPTQESEKLSSPKKTSDIDAQIADIDAQLAALGG